MKHPLDFIPSNSRKPIFFTLFLLTLILFAVFRILDQPLITSAAPNGIVSFELAGTPTAAQSMINSWDATARLFAAFGLGLDYLFMPTYAFALAFGILLAAGRHKGWVKFVGAVAGWGALAAPLFDAVENYSLWHILLGQVNSPYPAVAAFCATIKFSLLILGLLYALIAGILPKQS